MKRQRKGDDPICLSADLDYLYLLAMDGAQKMDNSAPMVNALIQLWEKHRHQLPINQKIRLAVVLLKNNHRESAMELVRSVKEHLTTTAQRGAHFAFKESESSVNMQPISLHVAAMEMFQMAGGEDALLEEMKVWLLLQKQAQQWLMPLLRSMRFMLSYCGARICFAIQENSHFHWEMFTGVMA